MKGTDSPRPACVASVPEARNSRQAAQTAALLIGPDPAQAFPVFPRTVPSALPPPENNIAGFIAGMKWFASWKHAGALSATQRKTHPEGLLAGVRRCEPFKPVCRTGGKTSHQLRPDIGLIGKSSNRILHSAYVQLSVSDECPSGRQTDNYSAEATHCQADCK